MLLLFLACALSGAQAGACPLVFTGIAAGRHQRPRVKLSPRTFRIEWDLHGWVGVGSSLLLFVLFFCGVFALYRGELAIWQDPRLHAAALPRVGAPLLDPVLAQLEAAGAARYGDRVSMITHAGTRLVTASITSASGASATTLWVDPQRAIHPVEAGRHSQLSEALYDLHFLHQLPAELELAGLFSVALLVSLLTGLLIHLKDLIRQRWRFRPDRPLRIAASDAHKVLGTLGLPFSLLFGWSGAVLCLLELIHGSVGSVALDGNGARLARLRGEPPQQVASATGQAAVRLPLDQLVQRAQAVLSVQEAPRFLDVEALGDRHETVRMYFQEEDLTPFRFVVLRTADASVVAQSSAALPAERFERVLFDLHFASVGGLLLKLGYTLLALGLCAVAVSGNLIWLERRSATRASASSRLLARLTIGVTAGLVLAAASIFAANRLLPAELEGRALLEQGVLFATWGASVASALLTHRPARSQLKTYATCAALLLCVVVLVDLATLDANLLTALPLGLPIIFIAESLLVLLAGACLAIARLMARPRPADQGASDDDAGVG